MSTVTEIVEAVRKLDQRQKGELLERLTEIDFEDSWDRQISTDSEQGKLDRLWDEALQDIQAGRIKPMDEILGDK